MARKQVQFLVTFTVEDEGDFDVSHLRGAVMGGVDIMHHEGKLSPVEDETTHFEGWEVVEYHPRYNPSSQVAIVWGTDDVKAVRQDLTEDQAMQVLVAVKYSHDATLGVTWDTLECQAQRLFGNPPADVDGEQATTDEGVL